MFLQCILDETVRCNKEIDYYVPVTFEFSGNDSAFGEALYYIFVDENSSLLEIAINSNNQKIIRAVLISMNGICEKKDFTSIENNIAKKIIGNPQIDKKCFIESNCFTDNRKIRFNYFGEKMYVLFDEKIQYEIVMEDLRIFTNEKMCVAGFCFEGFCSEESKLLEEVIQEKLDKTT